MIWLAGGGKRLRIGLAVSRECRRVMDGQTDGRTDILRRHSPRYASCQELASGEECSLNFISPQLLVYLHRT